MHCIWPLENLIDPRAQKNHATFRSARWRMLHSSITSHSVNSALSFQFQLDPIYETAHARALGAVKLDIFFRAKKSASETKADAVAAALITCTRSLSLARARVLASQNRSRPYLFPMIDYGRQSLYRCIRVRALACQVTTCTS